MLLDNGDQVFLWLGSRSSEVEVKLTYKAAQVSLICVLSFSLERVNVISFTQTGLHATPEGATASQTTTTLFNSQV